MPDGLYEHDALAWADHQAALLRRLAAGEGVNEAVDWPHVIEEVQDVGLSELRACRSLLRQALVHLLKLHAWPDSSAAAHWRDEVGVFLADAEDCFTPSMRQRIELDGLYAKALRLAGAATDVSGEPRPLPDTCPFTLDELLAGNAAELAARLGSVEGERQPAMTVEAERTVTIDQSDPNRGRVDRFRIGQRNPADTEPRAPVPAADIEATRAELAELRRRMTRKTD